MTDVLLISLGNLILHCVPHSYNPNLQALSVMLKYRTNTEKDAAKEESL